MGHGRKSLAKKMVMQPEYKMRVVPDHKKYNRVRDNKKEIAKNIEDYNDASRI